VNIDPKVKVLADASAIARAAAHVVVDAAKRSVSAGGRFTLVLSGGSTPKSLYSLLASDAALRAEMPWNETYFFFGDERCVAPDHPDSNYRMASEAMFGDAAVKPDHTFRIHGEERDPEKAAADYERALRGFFGVEQPRLPRFDLVLLGMGPDGHTASLFPGTRALEEHTQIVVANWIGKLYVNRVTMTVPLLNNAAAVLFMAHGHDKAPALKAVLEGPYEPTQLPSQLILPHNGKLTWLVDESAAAMLDRGTHSTRVAAG
jgi:6-phosphogluconolactonase